MCRSHRTAEGAGRSCANCIAGVSATRRTAGNAAGRVKPDVRRQIGAQDDGVTGLLAPFERKLVGRRVNLAEVVDAGIRLRGGASFYEVRNRDSRQEANDGHDNHDFHQRKARLADIFGRLHFTV